MSNTIPYEGDINELPRCNKCEKNSTEVDHQFMTYDHPYRMKSEENEDKTEK